MFRSLSLAIVLAVLASCAGAGSGSIPSPAPRGDRLDPVDSFPQARGANPYMRQ